MMVVVVVAPVSQWWWSVSPRVFLAKIPFLAFSHCHGNHLGNELYATWCWAMNSMSLGLGYVLYITWSWAMYCMSLGVGQ